MTHKDMERCFKNGEEVSGLSEVVHEPGQVMLLDFWFKGCGHCLKPMANNQKMVEEHGAEWGDRVRIIGMSCDKPEVVHQFCKERQWTNVEHYSSGWHGVTKTYGISGYPTIVLIDTKGTIVFKDHHPSFPLVEAINKLLAGETLSYKGTRPEDLAPELPNDFETQASPEKT